MGRKNPVAKNLNRFNKPATHKDRKKESKKNPPDELNSKRVRSKDLDQLDLFSDNKDH